MSDIFLSYSNEDIGRIGPLIHALESCGWTVFWDRTIPAGKIWRQVVGKELRDCRSMVVVWSRASVESEWVLEEAEEGKRRRVLVPVRIDDVAPPLGFGTIQAADFVASNGPRSAPELQRFIKDLSLLLGEPPKRGTVFTFGDLMNLTDRDMQTLVREIDMSQLSIALRGASEMIKSRFTKNMSTRAGQMLEDEIDAMGPVKLAMVENAQAELVKVASSLAEQGRITIGDPNDKLV